MKKEDLFESMTAIEDELIERSEAGSGKNPARPLWVKGGCVAAALALLLGLGGYFMVRPAGEGRGADGSLPGVEERMAGENGLAQDTPAQKDSQGTGEEDPWQGNPDVQQGCADIPQGKDGIDAENPPEQTGTPGQMGFEAPKGGKEVAAGSVDIGMLLNRGAETVSNEAMCITPIPVGEYMALYEQVSARSQEVLETSKGAPVEGTENCYRLGGHTDLQYLIMEGDGEDAYTLWEFAYFLQDTEYAYGEVLRLVYDIESAQDIVQIISRPANMDGSDQGKALQERIGEKTIEDRGQIEAIYQVISSMTCLGNGRWDLVGLGGDEPEQMLQAVQKGRYLTLVTAWDNEIDKLKYTGITGRFYQYSGVAYDTLEQEDKETVEEILEIE